MHTGQNWHHSGLQIGEIWNRLTLFSFAGFWIMQGSSFDLCCKLPIKKTIFSKNLYYQMFTLIILPAHSPVPLCSDPTDGKDRCRLCQRKSQCKHSFATKVSRVLLLFFHVFHCARDALLA